MSWTLRALLLILCLSVCAQAQTRTLGLYLQYARDLDPVSNAVMHEELERLIAPAGLDIVWKRLSDRKAGETFDLVAVTSFDGSCSLNRTLIDVPAAVSLADTSISNGRILPFFRIDCPYLLGMLGSQPDAATFGRALARVAAHEIYHIVAQTVEHQERGVAKASFSAKDLTAARFELDSWSIERMRLNPATVQVTSPASEISDLQSGR
ncbi:MAG TPA: hypothetical protein VKY31_02505 [Terriglobia bacterium]|nr:hypothetical protein [Terriglobia bacterium]